MHGKCQSMLVVFIVIIIAITNIITRLNLVKLAFFKIDLNYLIGHSSGLEVPLILLIYSEPMER